MKNKLPRLASFFFVSVIATSSAFAAPTGFTDLAAFTTAAGILSTVDVSTPLQTGPTLTFPGLTITIPDVDTSADANDPMFGNGVAGYTNSPSAFTFDFDSTITAFGVWISDLGTVSPTTFSVSVFSGANLLDTLTLFTDFSGAFGNALYGGVTDAGGFDKLVFSGSVSGDWVILSEIQIATTGATVPEPSTLALLGFGIAGIGYKRLANLFKIADINQSLS